MIVGLTGGIASGKSLVSQYLRELGIPVIDTDDIARQVVAPGQPAWQSLRETFGLDYFLADGQLDRSALARAVFTDTHARHTLEAITHPAIFAEVDRQLAEYANSSSPPPLIVVVVPLLFEIGAESHFDATVLVAADEAQQLDRLQHTRGYSREAATARIAAQLPLAEKQRRAHHLLDNTGSPAALHRQVCELVQRLIAHP